MAYLDYFMHVALDLNSQKEPIESARKAPKRQPNIRSISGRLIN